MSSGVQGTGPEVPQTNLLLAVGRICIPSEAFAWGNYTRREEMAEAKEIGECVRGYRWGR